MRLAKSQSPVFACHSRLAVRMKISAMLEENEDVARNISKAQKAIQEEESCRKEEKEESGASVNYEKEVEALDWTFP